MSPTASTDSPRDAHRRSRRYALPGLSFQADTSSSNGSATFPSTAITA